VNAVCLAKCIEILILTDFKPVWGYLTPQTWLKWRFLRAIIGYILMMFYFMLLLECFLGAGGARQYIIHKYFEIPFIDHL
jgi:hypothetical protein